MSEKIKKTARLDLRVATQLKERIEDTAKNMSMSRNLLIEHILWKVILSPKEYFICCPECGIPMFDVERIPISEGSQDFTCQNGHTNHFDFETEQFVELNSKEFTIYMNSLNDDKKDIVTTLIRYLQKLTDANIITKNQMDLARSYFKP